MKFLILFFLHPINFFNKIFDEKYKYQVSVIIIAYSVLYICSGLYFESLIDSPYGTLFYVENKYFAVFISLAFEFGISILLSFLIYFLKFLSTRPLKISIIILSVLSLKVISIFIIIFKTLYSISPFQFDIPFISIIHFIFEMIYLFIAIKTIFETTNFKTLLIQCTSVIIILITGYTLYEITRDESNQEIQRGLDHLASFEFEKAAKILSSVVEGDPTNAKVYYYLGETYRKQVLFSRYGELTPQKMNSLLSKSEDFFNKVLAIDSEYYDARIGLARVYVAQKKYEDALKQFNMVIKQDPDNSDLNKEIGKIYQKLNKPEMAKRFFRLSSKDEGLDESYKEEHRLITNDEIKIITGKKIKIESNIIWHVTDPVIYQGAILSESIAESRILDVYQSILRTIIIIKNYQEAPNEFGDEIKNEIIEECNNAILRKNYGIEIKDLKLRVM